MMKVYFLRAGALAAGVAALSILAPAPGQAASKSAPTAPAAFARCAACHATGAGKPHGIGPNLFGVAGKKAGTRPGYAYSPALRNSGRVWTRAEMVAYIANPAQAAPGTTMINPGVVSAADRVAIAQYLEKLK